MSWHLSVTLPHPELTEEQLSSLGWDSGTNGIYFSDTAMVAGFDTQSNAENLGARVGGSVTRYKDVLQPSVEQFDFDLAGEQVSIKLDTTKSFGHGSHPTTKLVVDQLLKLNQGPTPSSWTERSDDAGPRPTLEHSTCKTFLDIGTGSGILSLIMASAGAKVVAVDTCLDAVDQATQNAADNNLSITVKTGSAEQAEGQFDLCAVNVLLVAHREISSYFPNLLEPSGKLVVAGFLRDQIPEITSLYDPLSVIHQSESQGWHCLVFENT